MIIPYWCGCMEFVDIEAAKELHILDVISILTLDLRDILIALIVSMLDL